MLFPRIVALCVLLCFVFASDRENTKLAITMTLKYVLQTECTRVTETEVETQVLARIVQQNQEWPGLCTDSACTNAHVTGTCDGAFPRSINTVVVIEQVPDIVRSNDTQSTGSSGDVLLTAAVQNDAFDLQTINATLQKEIQVSVVRTCTPGYIAADLGTHCVKPEEPSSISPALMGSIIGGVVAFLVLVILISLVIVVYRRLNRPDTRRRPSTGRERQDDEHDYSSLTPAGRYAGPDHRGQRHGIELGRLDLDLTNPSYDDKNGRPVSDYDVIGEENPEIAKYLAESSLDKKHPGYLSLSIPQKNADDVNYSNNVTDVKDTNNVTDVNDSEYLTPHLPRKNGDGEDQADYITPCSPDESNKDKNKSDYITLCSPDERSEDKIDSDNITPCSGKEDLDNELGH
ncbi:uncharacterized protein [Littorina saxatilis]|uniref:Uncharacterized protein n=1 Tax=Littorina saxatilis TaxID=31220 RepID=A0AAN9G454_9CAEN